MVFFARRRLRLIYFELSTACNYWSGCYAVELNLDRRTENKSFQSFLLLQSFFINRLALESSLGRNFSLKIMAKILANIEINTRND